MDGWMDGFDFYMDGMRIGWIDGWFKVWDFHINWLRVVHLL